jgi:hypothetical protein
MFTQYTKQLLSILFCSTLVNFYLLVILHGELLLKKAATYVVKKVGLETHKEINLLV